MLIRDLDSNIQLMVTSYLITMLFSMFSLCYLVIKSGGSPLRTSFTITQIVTILWLLFALRERVSPTSSEILFNIRISLICINFIAPLWTITILFFTGQLSGKARWLIPIILTAPFVLSVPMLFPASSDIFRLYIKELYMDEQARILYETWGPFELLTVLTSLASILLSFFALLIYFRKNNSIKPIEKVAALLTLWSPIIIHYIGLLINAPFDLTPLSFSIWGAITIYLSFQRQFFNTVPSLVWNIFNETQESMAVLGIDGSVNVNKTFLTVFGSRKDDFMNFADELSSGLSGYIRQKRDVIGLEAEKDGIQYEISIKNVLGKRNKAAGQLITIKDVSETKQLTLTRERARIASGLHDNMGNRLIASVNNLNLALIQPTQTEAKPFISSAATSAIASLMMLRRIVEGLTPVDFNKAKLIPLIKSAVDRISASGICVDLQISDNLEKLPVYLKEFVYNTCQEALTNSVIHGNAENISLKLEYAIGILKIDIVDNGRGCEVIHKNNGLAAIEARVKTLEGITRFWSLSLGGFGIYAEIPVKEGIPA